MGKPMEGDSKKLNYSISLSDEANNKVIAYSELHGMSKSMYIQTLILAETATNQFIDYQNRIKQLDEIARIDASQTESQIKFLENQIQMLRDQLNERNAQRETEKTELLNMSNIIKAKNDPNSVIVDGYDEFKDKSKIDKEMLDRQPRQKSYNLYCGNISGERNFHSLLCSVIDKYHSHDRRAPSHYDDEHEWELLKSKAEGIKWSNISYDDIQALKSILNRQEIPQERSAPILAIIDKWLNPSERS